MTQNLFLVGIARACNSQLDQLKNLPLRNSTDMLGSSLSLLPFQCRRNKSIQRRSIQHRRPTFLVGVATFSLVGVTLVLISRSKPINPNLAACPGGLCQAYKSPPDNLEQQQLWNEKQDDDILLEELETNDIMEGNEEFTSMENDSRDSPTRDDDVTTFIPSQQTNDYLFNNMFQQIIIITNNNKSKILLSKKQIISLNK